MRLFSSWLQSSLHLISLYKVQSSANIRVCEYRLALMSLIYVRKSGVLGLILVVHQKIHESSLWNGHL